MPDRFNEIFEGIVLAYDVNILEKNGKILSGIHPYFGVRLKAKLLLFSPKPNMLLGIFSRSFTIPVLFTLLSDHKDEYGILFASYNTF